MEVYGNWIEARQWIVAQHPGVYVRVMAKLSMQNPGGVDLIFCALIIELKYTIVYYCMRWKMETDK